MGYYRRMGSMEQRLGGNAEPSTLLHYQLRDRWKSPRGAVIRIEAFSLVAIFLSFIVVAFGSCRRWSNKWIVQKGFLAAQVLSLSLGTYSIGLMQSSPVKSEMYPIWAVSLLTLFGCVDPVTTYNGLNYKGPLTKTIFQLCLYCGYVLLLISSISGVFDNLALSVLSAVTFVKGFHRSMALVLPSRTRDQIEEHDSTEPSALAGDGMELKVHVSIPCFMRRGRTIKKWYRTTSMAEIYSTWNIMPSELGLASTSSCIKDIEDVCLGYSLSHLLRRRFIGLDTAREMKKKRQQFENLVRDGKDIAYKRTLKAIEVELAFLYEILFTSNEFLHYHEAKTSSFWALASFIGICFVGVVVAIPGTKDSHKQPIIFSGSSASVVVVHTTAADLITTLVILVSLAVLQLVQLIRCWTSNWARVLFASEYVSSRKAKIAQQGKFEAIDPKISTSWWLWMRLKVFVVTRMNWFDNKYLWQDKLGQYSLVDDAWSHSGGCCVCIPPLALTWRMTETWGCLFGRLLGLQYIGQVLRELWVTDSNTGPAVRLQEDMKPPITRFLHQIKSPRMKVEDWSSWFVHNGIEFEDLPFNNGPLFDQRHKIALSEAYAFTHRVMRWHAATCYCQVRAEQDAETEGGEAGRSSSESEKNRRVAMALSKYCAYLVVSAPELLPGPSAETKRAHKDALEMTKAALYDKKDPGLVTADGLPAGRFERKTSTLQESMSAAVSSDHKPHPDDAYQMGVHLGMKLTSETRPCPDHWEVLARLWVHTLVYAAPYGDMQSHLQHLSQGGEFITHLWALLYHIGIDSWEREPHQSAGAARARGYAPNLSTEAEIEELN